MLLPGDPAPWFVERASNRDEFHFSAAGGRYVVLCFFGTTRVEAGGALWRAFVDRAAIYDDRHASLFGVSVDPDDERSGRVTQRIPGVRLFWDYDRKISRLYGAIEEADERRCRPVIYVLDPALRVLSARRVRDPQAAAAETVDFVRALPPIPSPEQAAPQAPALVVPGVFERDFCRALIAGYERGRSEESGFMREVDGKTTLIVDHAHKRRFDWTIDDTRLRGGARARIHRRVAPEVQRVFQFAATRIERYIVACYDADVGGYFRPHRDNTTKGTAHRRFAITINLNAEEYDGGDLVFPEYGQRSFRAPTGGAVVFSCSLLHEALPVARGKRYAFLPFLYDEEAAKLRAANNSFLGDGVRLYRLEDRPA